MKRTYRAARMATMKVRMPAIEEVMLRGESLFSCGVWVVAIVSENEI